MDDRTLLIAAVLLLAGGALLAARDKAWPLVLGLAGLGVVAYVLAGRL